MTLVSTKTFTVIKVFTTPATLLGRNRAARHPLADESPLNLPGFHPLILDAGIRNRAVDSFAGHRCFRFVALTMHTRHALYDPDAILPPLPVQFVWKNCPRGLSMRS